MHSTHTTTTTTLFHQKQNGQQNQEEGPKRKSENPTIEMEMQWEDHVAHFGGVYVIEQAGSHTPEDVLHVFTQSAYLRKQRGEHIVQPLPVIYCKTVETIEAETGKMINEKCFEFLQKVVMKNNTLVHSKSRDYKWQVLAQKLTLLYLTSQTPSSFSQLSNQLQFSH